MYFLALAVLVVNHVRNVWHGGYHVHVEFAVESLLNNLHVQQSEESAAESEAQRNRTLRHESKRCVVKLKFLERCSQILEILGLDRVDAGKHHRLYLLKSGNSLLAWVGNVRKRVAHLNLGGCLDARNDVAHVAAMQFLTWRQIHLQNTDFVG